MGGFQDFLEILASIFPVSGLVYAWGDNRNGLIGLEGGKKDGVASENTIVPKGLSDILQMWVMSKITIPLY